MDIGEHKSGVAKLRVFARIKIFGKGNGPEYILLIRRLCSQRLQEVTAATWTASEGALSVGLMLGGLSLIKQRWLASFE